MLKNNDDQNTLKIVVCILRERQWFNFKSYEGLFCKKDGSFKLKRSLRCQVKNIMKKKMMVNKYDTPICKRVGKY